MRGMIILFGVLLITACAISIAHTTKDRVTDKEYVLHVHGNSFSTEEDLMAELSKESDKICGPNSYTIDKNYHVKDEVVPIGVVPYKFSKGVIDARVNCIN